MISLVEDGRSGHRLPHERGKLDRVVRLEIAVGQTKILRGVYYKGTVKMKILAYRLFQQMLHAPEVVPT
jgi:hypothetical protein